MASTNFSYGTVIASTWLNDVNAAVYNTIPNLAPKTNAVLTTPNIGAATATSINKNFFTTPANNCQWSLSDGKTFTVTNTVTISGVDGASLALGSGANTFSGTASGNNTGDQLTFKNFAVSGQPTVVATTTTDTLTIVGGSGVSVTTDATAKTVTLSSNSSSAMVLLGQATVTTPVSEIGFRNLFTSAYDTYEIVFQGLTNNGSGNQPLSIRFSLDGTTLDGNSTYSDFGSSVTVNNTRATLTPQVPITNAPGAPSGTVRVINSNSTGPIFKIMTAATVGLGVSSFSGAVYNSSVALKGFALLTVGTGSFNAGTVRVYGIKNT